jgi:hypothetical protein
MTERMSKTEAAEMLAIYITVEARRAGITQITRDYIQEMQSEARHAGIPGSLIRQAAETYPSWRTIRTAGRRIHNEREA